MPRVPAKRGSKELMEIRLLVIRLLVQQNGRITDTHHKIGVWGILPLHYVYYLLHYTDGGSNKVPYSTQFALN
jgi:hypothetical protein